MPENDRSLIKGIAENLRAGGEIAEQTRVALNSVLIPYSGMNLKELIEAAPPLEQLDLQRSRESWRDIDF